MGDSHSEEVPTQAEILSWCALHISAMTASPPIPSNEVAQKQHVTHAGKK